MTLSALHLILLLAGILTLVVCLLVLILQLRRLKKDLHRCRAEQTLCVPPTASAPPATADSSGPTASFGDSLLQASLKQRLQTGADWRPPPEKYGYAAALADQGMDAEGIAAVLQFPIEAAQQIVTLKRAARGRQNPPDKDLGCKCL